MSNHAINSCNPLCFAYLSEGVRRCKPSPESQCSDKFWPLITVSAWTSDKHQCLLSQLGKT